MLRDITIENYRLFEKFHLKGMTQVNLLVGMNNSGKSSLLEAIYLLMNNEISTALFEILDVRFSIKSRIRRGAEILDLHDTFQMSGIFREYQLNQSIMISSYEDEVMRLEYKFVNYEMPWPDKKEDEAGLGLRFKGKDADEVTSFFSERGSVFSRSYREQSLIEKSKVNKYFVTTERLNQQAISKLWERVVLTPKEDMVLEALRILEPNLERVAFVDRGVPEMSALFKTKNNDIPLPLGSMGDGMYRIFALALSLVNCENGALFVDEIDTGLHYKALTQMWHLVIETAKKLNVQVFATTHSWDCLSSFHKALSETGESELGSVFRLERKNGQIDYVAYTGEELAVAVEHDIEVR